MPTKNCTSMRASACPSAPIYRPGRFARFLAARLTSFFFRACCALTIRGASRAWCTNTWPANSPSSRRSCRAGHFDSARKPQRQKYLRDAELLSAAPTQEPDNARHQFYLAQNLRDAGEPERVLAAYRKRATMVGWEEEAATGSATLRPPSA